MIKTQILLRKTIEDKKRLLARVRFLLFCSELTPTDPWCDMLRTLIAREKYEEAMSDEHPQMQEFNPISWWQIFL